MGGQEVWEEWVGHTMVDTDWERWAKEQLRAIGMQEAILRVREQSAMIGMRYTIEADSGSDLGEGEPWLLLALFGHTLTLN